MSDLLSVLLVMMEDEVDAFWCFAGLMDRVVCVYCALVALFCGVGEINTWYRILSVLNRCRRTTLPWTRAAYPPCCRVLGVCCALSTRVSGSEL
jgi:hypothetical protein